MSVSDDEAKRVAALDRIEKTEGTNAKNTLVDAFTDGKGDDMSKGGILTIMLTGELGEYGDQLDKTAEQVIYAMNHGILPVVFFPDFSSVKESYLAYNDIINTRDYDEEHDVYFFYGGYSNTYIATSLSGNLQKGTYIP